MENENLIIDLQTSVCDAMRIIDKSDLKILFVAESTEGVDQGVNAAGSSHGLQLVVAPDNPAAGRGHHLGIVVQDFAAALQEMLGYATVASPPAEPPERVRTCSTDFAA